LPPQDREHLMGDGSHEVAGVGEVDVLQGHGRHGGGPPGTKRKMENVLVLGEDSRDPRQEETCTSSSCAAARSAAARERPAPPPTWPSTTGASPRSAPSTATPPRSSTPPASS